MESGSLTCPGNKTRRPEPPFLLFLPVCKNLCLPTERNLTTLWPINTSTPTVLNLCPAILGKLEEKQQTAQEEAWGPAKAMTYRFPSKAMDESEKACLSQAQKQGFLFLNFSSYLTGRRGRDSQLLPTSQSHPTGHKTIIWLKFHEPQKGMLVEVFSVFFLLCHLAIKQLIYLFR